MHRIGVIGPPESIERILDVANEYEHEIKFIPFPYQEAREAKNIVTEHQHQVNGWFFSGPMPYTMAKRVLGSIAEIVLSTWAFGISNTVR